MGLKRSRLFGTEDQGFVEYDIGAGTLSLGNTAPDWKPSPNGGSVGLEVDDFDAAIAKLRSSGCPFLFEPIETQVCDMAVMSDPGGNSVTTHGQKSG